ncbi:hypothetical protein [Hymenobacter negativus]|uniref:hypothetical protein n=1 Tax=Hymenobacter negativus TaxID=2795026 RepID=UPI0018DD6477|nr:hypothetical protein [Hymenobacter negativus]MBH8567586.1 hypothetical protein [Hymenobacter negativus]
MKREKGEKEVDKRFFGGHCFMPRPPRGQCRHNAAILVSRAETGRSFHALQLYSNKYMFNFIFTESPAFAQRTGPQPDN